MSEKTNQKPVKCGCGGEASVDFFIGEPSEGTSYVVYCRKCEIQTMSYDTMTEAVEAWNRAMGATDIHVGDKFAKDINVPTKERNKGKWQRRKDEDCWECSECHAVLENSDVGNHNFYYCYHCGADMMDICGYMEMERGDHE